MVFFHIAEHLRHHHITSLREQLQVAGGANNSIMQTSQTATVTTPGTQKSIFSRLGIRKPSILSLSSPLQPSTTSRTFSLDDLLRPLPRRKLMQSFFSPRTTLLSSLAIYLYLQTQLNTLF